MRKLNAIISVILTVLFLFHLVTGGLLLAGFDDSLYIVSKVSAFILLAAITVHIVICVKFTADTFKALGKTGSGYFAENGMFWVRRISGVAVLVFAVLHAIMLTGDNYMNYGFPQLMLSVLFVASLAVHLIGNIRPLMIAFGLGRGEKISVTVMLVLSTALLASGAAFCVYFVR
ncbi:MAG: hypothetical protein IK093_01115 [Ruminiclostridium sp.]|nr:hypothetical protein [Ruminiclostridium sp.]